MPTARVQRFVICWPWQLHYLQDGPVVGADCRSCRRNIARPRAATREPICIYCGIDLGLIAEDQPFGTGTPLNNFSAPRRKLSPAKRRTATVLEFRKSPL